MNCSENGPLFSRLLDEDLTPVEIERLLQHLSSCANCQKELDSLENLRTGFQGLGETESVPWPEEAFLERTMMRVEQEGNLGEEKVGRVAYPLHPRGQENPSWRERMMAWVYTVIPSPAWARPLGYAVPILIVLMVGVWLMPLKEKETIDVAYITPTREPSATLSQSPVPFDEYVFDHTTQQPLGNIGDELPLIQEVGDSGR